VHDALQYAEHLIVVELFRVALAAKVIMIDVDDVLQVFLLESELLANVTGVISKSLSSCSISSNQHSEASHSVIPVVSMPMARVRAASFR